MMSNSSEEVYPLPKPLPRADFFYDGTYVENLRSYKPGGLHPVHLGDTFSTCPGSDRPRYRILQKLGQGVFSTVWLTQDMADNDRGVALKITTADFHEAAILQSLSSPADNSHPGKKYVLQLLDHFQIHGPNGIHDVLVTDVLVPKQYLPDLRILDPKRTVYQTLLALSYLSECGVIHDLHADNIVFSFPGLAELTAQAWMNILGYPDLIAVIPRKFEDQSDSLPKYLVETADIEDVVESVISKNGKEGIYAVVIDFGSASRVSDPIPDSEPRTPPYICAPEIIIRTLYLKEGFYLPEWRFQGDIWSLGCSIYEMVAGGRLFNRHKDHLLDEIIQLAGPLPQSWLNRLKEQPQAHRENDESSLQAAAELYRRKRFTGEAGFGSPLRVEAGFHSLLGSMLKVDPYFRLAPEVLIQNPWFDDLRGEI